MRVALVGRPEDRSRVRQQLRDAGIEVVAESTTERDTWPEGPIDAVVTATAEEVDGRLGAAAGPRARDESISDVETLTAREHDVLALLVEGLSNKAIAGALGISDQTVKFHVAAITGKLGASNRTDAVRRAIRRGLVAI